MRLYFFLIASALSLLAYRSFNIILVWFIVTKSSNSLDLGTIVALMWAFNLTSLPLVGDSFDRFKKKNILILGGIFSLSFSLIFLIDVGVYSGSITIISMCACVLAVTNSITTASINTLLPFIATKEQLDKSVSLAATFNSAQSIIGSVIGGTMIALLGVEPASLVVVSFFLVSLVLILFLSINEKGSVSVDIVQGEKFISRITQGFKTLHYIKSEKIICYTAMLNNFVLTPLLMVVLPYYVSRELKSDATTLALLESMFAVGMLSGAALISKLDFNLYKRIYPIVLGNMMIGIGVILFSVFDWVYIKALGLCISGFGLTVKGVACNSVRVFAVPNSYRGKLEGAILFLCIGTIPLGSYLFGYFQESFDYEQKYCLIGYMGVIIFFTSFLPIFSKKTRFVLGQSNQKLDGLYKSMYPSAFKQ
ncbi:MFS transporter [Vibrio apostichopi]|uniref:MFS transporter n=1 Tax=Vibrio apostichopi TaxID=3035453 RepID=UPI002572F2FB|nr:MFS transporter [Vibrio sp. FE10]